MTLQIGFLLFPQVQQLDLTGPYDVLASLPDVQVHLIWKDLVPVTASTGLLLKPTTTFEDCPDLDVICIPGGAGVGPLMEDEQTLGFIKRQAAQARYVTSVCTGSLVLGAAVNRLAAGQGAATAVGMGFAAFAIGWTLVRFLSAASPLISDVVFAPVRAAAQRATAAEAFAHALSLSLDFHQTKRSGALSRTMDRGSAMTSPRDWEHRSSRP